MPIVQGGRAVPIAVTSAKRGGIPGVPTIAESDIPDFDITSWNAIFCRSGTPEQARHRLEEAINAATSTPR
jgi:tripartite-type tricarboxylate transporter receptor subunit TctC